MCDLVCMGVWLWERWFPCECGRLNPFLRLPFVLNPCAFLPPGPRSAVELHRDAFALKTPTLGEGGCQRLAVPLTSPMSLRAAPPSPGSQAAVADHGGGAGAASLDGAPSRIKCAAPRLAPPGPGAQLHGASAAAASRRGGCLLQPSRLAGQPLLRQPGPRARARFLQSSAR